MLKPEQIPDEVVKALKASTQWSSFWHDDDMKELIAAAINAWPGMRMAAAEQHLADDGMRTFKDRRIILPLPQEARDE